MLTSDSSLRLNLLRFPLILGVVFIHAYGTTLEFATGAIGVPDDNFISAFLQNLISNGLARIAVPIFFLMSGYLFFMKFTLTKKEYIEKLKSRFKTLLIPFVFWNSLTLLAIAIAQTLPATQIYFSGKNLFITNFNFFDYLSALFGIGRMPIAYQFWFIRDLMVLIILTPLIYTLNKIQPFVFLCLLVICWFLNSWPMYLPSIDATLFFSVGAFLAATKRNLFALDKYGKAIIIIYLLIVVIDVFFITVNRSFNFYSHKIGITFGVLAILSLTQFVSHLPVLRDAILALSNSSFFVYAAHEPLLTVARKIAYKLILPDSSYMVLGLYCTIPIVVVIFLVFIYSLLARLFPKFTRIITGGR